jgi:hypothetical protein
MLIALAALLIHGFETRVARADEGGEAPRWEFTAGPDLGLNINFSGGSTRTTLLLGPNLNVEIGYEVVPHLHLVLSPLWAHSFASDGLPSSDSIELLGGVNYSLSEDLRSSPFLLAQAGIERVSGGGFSETEFVWEIGVGQRFALNPCVSYRPMVSYLHMGGTPATGSLRITPVAFSFFL